MLFAYGTKKRIARTQMTPIGVRYFKPIMGKFSLAGLPFRFIVARRGKADRPGCCLYNRCRNKN